MTRKVRLGIIGAGAIGQAHLKACQQCTGVKVMAICDVDEGRAKAAAAEFSIPRALGDYRAMLAQDSLDAVSICTPNNTHMPIAVAALQAGKHVLCEKPLAMNARQGRKIVAAAQRAGRMLMVAQSARYGAGARFVKKLTDQGRFGDLYYAQVVWLRRRGIPRGWFQDVEQSGGGPLIDLGVHAIDLVWWLMGRPKPACAFGVTFDQLARTGQGIGNWGVGYNPTEFSVEDMVAGMIRFADGRAVGLSISWAAHTGDGYWLRVFGTKGGAQLSPEVVIYRTEGGAMVDVRPQLPKVNSYAEEMEHFADCVKKGQEPISPGSQAVVVMEMLDGIYRAARSGRAATIRHD